MRCLCVAAVAFLAACSLLTDVDALRRATGAEDAGTAVVSDAALQDVLGAPSEASNDAAVGSDGGSADLRRAPASCSTGVAASAFDGLFGGWSLVAYSPASAQGIFFERFRCDRVLGLGVRFGSPAVVTDAPALGFRRSLPANMPIAGSMIIEQASTPSETSALVGVSMIYLGMLNDTFSTLYTSWSSEGTLRVERFTHRGAERPREFGRPAFPFRLLWRVTPTDAFNVTVDLTVEDGMRTERDQFAVPRLNADTVAVTVGVNATRQNSRNTVTLSDVVLP